MEVAESFYRKIEFIETVSMLRQFGINDYIHIVLVLMKSSGNKVSKNSVMCGSQNIILQGRVSRTKETIANQLGQIYS
jgi:hypothetical protein